MLGTPPPALGKRKLEAYKEFGREAVAAMKFLPVSDGEQMPKRGRGCGEGTVIYPRGSMVSCVVHVLEVSSGIQLIYRTQLLWRGSEEGRQIRGGTF